MSFSLPLGDHVTLSVCVYLPVLQGQICPFIRQINQTKLLFSVLIIYKIIFHGNYFKYCILYYIILYYIQQFFLVLKSDWLRGV